MWAITMPAFDLDAGKLLLTLVRAVAVAGLLSGFGSLVFAAGLARPSPRAIEQRIRRLAGASLAAALLGLLGWLGLEAATLSGASSPGEALAAIPKVLSLTKFGHLIMWQTLALVVAAAALALRATWLAALAAGVATALEAGHLHAWAMEPGPSLLLASEGLHLLAAGVWLGGLLPLLIVVRTAPLEAAAARSRRFSPIATVAVLVLSATALWQGWELSGGWAGLVGTAYGWVELIKFALFLALLACAGLNRFRFTPALTGAGAARVRGALGRSIAVETAIGLLVVLAAALLTGLEPGMHLQPVWPFAVRPSLAIVEEDPAFRREVTDAVLALLGALALVGLGVIVRWIRWVAWPVAAVIAWFAVPHFDLLLVEAYPTSFYRSPTGFAASAIVAGSALYPQHCAACHGTEGRGDGPAAKGLPAPPADLTAEHLLAHSDGELFWWILHGVVSPEGEVAMPGFSGTLSDDQIWGLIDYVRARNAGDARRDAGAWPLPVQAPSLDAVCGGRTRTLSDLRGEVVRVVFGAAATLPADAPAATVLLAPVDTPAPPGDCVASDPAVAQAYAITAGLSAQRSAGAEILIDANGWLRAVLPAAAEADTAAEIRRLARAPLPAGAGMGHMHHHG